MGVARALGDDQRALELGASALSKFDQLKPTDEQQQRNKYFYLRWAHNEMAQAAYQVKDYAAAESHMAQILDIRKKIPARRPGEKREAAIDEAFAALMLSRLNRQAEAQRLIAPALKFERELSPLNHDDPSQRLELAITLYVAAVAGLGDPAAQLTEAAALIDHLPQEMRQLRSTALIRNDIALEQKGRGK